MVWFGKRWRRFCLRGLIWIGLGMIGFLDVGCAGDACQRYFQEVKRRCQLGSTAEGTKLDQYLQQVFKPCQLDVCDRSNINNINCLNPNTHIPGGIDGRFTTCQNSEKSEP